MKRMRKVTTLMRQHGFPSDFFEVGYADRLPGVWDRVYKGGWKIRCWDRTDALFEVYEREQNQSDPEALPLMLHKRLVLSHIIPTALPFKFRVILLPCISRDYFHYRAKR